MLYTIRLCHYFRLVHYMKKMKKPVIIVVTWWVLSWIGKGITASSIGALLRACGYTVCMQKMDGYLNVDAGTINPYKHGECFVTDDGAETDLDIWHYERFIDTNLTAQSIYTMGKLYHELINAERDGSFLGQDVQMIPHMSSLIKSKIIDASVSAGADFHIVEIGGTVGDIENEILIESVRQLKTDLDPGQVLFFHLTYIPYLLASKELKTKPTQNSIKDLRRQWINPDIVFLRADYDIPDDIRKKVSTMCGIHPDYVIPLPTLTSIYAVPEHLASYQVTKHLHTLIQRPYTKPNLQAWHDLTHHIKNATTIKHVAMVGKYGSLEDAYYSLNEWLKVAWFHHGINVILHFIDPGEISNTNVAAILGPMDGICVPWWFGKRGIEGMVIACHYARTQKIPYLWICLGSQVMAIEFARHVLGLDDATSTEFDEENLSEHHVIHLMHDQKNQTKKWGTMRLGSYPCLLSEGKKITDLYRRFGWLDKQSLIVTERHRHRYEFNTMYKSLFEEAWFVFSGTSPDGTLIEMVELRDHPFMLATQAHPEFLSRPLNPHPLFRWFIQAIQDSPHETSF